MSRIEIFSWTYFLWQYIELFNLQLWGCSSIRSSQQQPKVSVMKSWNLVFFNLVIFDQMIYLFTHKGEFLKVTYYCPLKKSFKLTFSDFKGFLIPFLIFLKVFARKIHILYAFGMRHFIYFFKNNFWFHIE